MDKHTFKRRAESLVRQAHPDASIAFRWTHCERVTWADGSVGISGVLTVAAPGYRARRMVASMLDGRISVR